MKKIRKTHVALDLPTITLEGTLFLPGQLEKAAQGRARWQEEADYDLPKGVTAREEQGRAFRIAVAQWKHFETRRLRADVDAAAVTRDFVREWLRDALGWRNLTETAHVVVEARQYPVAFVSDHVPVVIAPHTLELDEADARFKIDGANGRKKSAFQLAQELLNASPGFLWGIVCNGRSVRLLRNAATLTRPSYLEIDLQGLLASGQRYSEFVLVWRLLHASRAGKSEQAPEDAIWEGWRKEGEQEGARVREGLRAGVTEALRILGEGFLQHRSNDALRVALGGGVLSAEGYYQQLLRLAYRLIFLFCVEERGLLHPADDSMEALAARQAYAEGYAQSRLRAFCLKRRARNRFDDQWQAVRIVFRGLAAGEPRLALPALGGLFAPDQCAWLDVAGLSNAHFMAALENLRWAMVENVRVPVDYRNMGPEELGSVYESLLELAPEIDLAARRFDFIGLTAGAVAGNARKLTGSYYTPDSLVRELIRSALDPVIAARIAASQANPADALLAIRVIDPACGSGHFLLAAARRLAEEVARLRAETKGEDMVKPADYRHALREVMAHCIFGVDKNPLALELARMALWLEGFEEGRPLTFIDHHLRCGDALVGLIDKKTLELGIAKDAYEPLTGDDRDVCRALARANASALADWAAKREAIN